MRLKEAVASVLQLCVILLFFAITSFCFLLPFRADWRSNLIGYLQEEPEFFYEVGAFFGIAGVLLLLGFYTIGRGRFLQLSMKPHMATVDVKLLQRVIEECFQTHFPKHVRSSDIAIISKQRLEVAVDMVPMEIKSQLILMREMEQKLGSILRERFGYAKPFTLSVQSK